MKKICDAADRASAKLPYVLQDSPLDPAMLVVVAPMVLGYAAVILIANII